MSEKQIYQVLVVDDEPYVLQTISMMLEEHVPFELELFRTGSAAEALAIMSRRRIDILITDIQMPGIDGLQLAHIVRQRWRDCLTIILTAHADFSYARSALREDVFGYALKSESDELFIEVFLSAVRQLDAQLDDIERLVSAQSISSERISFFIRETLRELIHNAASCTPEHYAETLTALGCPDPSKPVSLFCLAAPRGGLHESSVEQLSYLSGRFLEPMTGFLSTALVGDRYFGLMQLRDGLKTGSLKDQLSSVVERYSEATGQVAVCLLAPSLSGPEELNKLCMSIANGKILSVDEPFVRQINVNTTATAYADTVLTQLTSYIEKNIFGDVCLETLANVAGYNASYLSRLFFKRMGMTLSNYIADQKLRHILVLLNNRSCSLDEIMEITGFESRSALNRFIKRMTGYSPKQYREIHQFDDDTEQK